MHANGGSMPTSSGGATTSSGGTSTGSGGTSTGSGGTSTGSGGTSTGSGGTTTSSGGTTTSSGGTTTSSGGTTTSSGGTTTSSGGTTTSSGGTTTSSGGTTTSSGGTTQSPTMYKLVVDAPASQAMVHGMVPVTGLAPGFQNVEIWDANHANPPLARTTPKSDGTFSTSVDASSLSTGATTWMVHAWDSAPQQSFMHSDEVDVPLTITTGSGGSCSGQTCSGHGTCNVNGGQAACSCDASYHAVGLTCVPNSTGGDGTPDPGTAYVPSGYKLTFSDEFDGSTVNTGKWNTLAPWGVQFFSDSHQQQAFIPEGVTLANGLATFTARKSQGNTGGQPYSSGSLTTNGTFTHGYFEARVRVPAGKGFWPAYWLTSSTRWPPEWDIFEIIDGNIFGYTHPVSGGKCSFVDGAAGSDSTYTIPNVYGVFHVYGFEWTSTDIYWYVDGTMTEHYAIDAAAGANDPFWLNVSLQVGGDWPGNPDGSTPLPAHMDVDYVRVYSP